MLLTGFSETLVRLFVSSSFESSEKRLDGLAAASTLESLCLGRGMGFSKFIEARDVDGWEGYRPKGSGDNGMVGELEDTDFRNRGLTAGIVNS